MTRLGDGPVLLAGPGSSVDGDLLRTLVAATLDDAMDDVVLTRRFSGEVRFEFVARFVRGRLVVTDGSLSKRTRRLYEEE